MSKKKHGKKRSKKTGPKPSTTAPIEAEQAVKTEEQGAATAVGPLLTDVVSKEPKPEVHPRPSRAARPPRPSRAVRVRSSSECATASSCPEQKKVNISVDNDPVANRRPRIPINYFKPPKDYGAPRAPEITDKKVQAKDTREPPAPTFPKPRRFQSKADNDMNWRAPKAPCNRDPTNFKGLSIPEMRSVALTKEKEGAQAFMGFTGGENLNLTAFENYVDVLFGESNLEDEDKKALSWTMDGLISMINPVWRQKNVVVSMDEIFEAATANALLIEDSERAPVISEKGAFLVKETLLWMRRLFFVFCCGAGFIAQDFVGDQTPRFLEVSKLDHKNELQFTLEFADRLAKSVIVPDCKELLEASKNIREMIDLVAKEDVGELAKKNVVFALSNPVERLRFGRPISDDELFEIVDTSVTTDCGKYLWIVDRCPEKLKGSARIVASIVKGISLKRVSKDQRPARAYYMLMPQLLASLTEEELRSLAEEHVENRERKVENWPEMMYEGFLMCLSNIHGKPRDTNDIVLLKLLQSTATDDLKYFLIACALIAEFDPGLCRRIYDFSTDSFCTRMARVFMNVSPEKRSFLLKALMSLPEPFKDRLLAREGFRPELSLYHSVKVICTEMSKVSTAEIRATGPLVIRDLSSILSPARMISFAIIPCLSHASARIRAACLLPELLACEKLPEELLDENGVLTPADLVKIALEQYEEPQGTAPKARYGFIEKILKTVDAVLEADVPQRIIDGIDVAFEEKGLTWQQHYALAHITFPKSHTKLKLPPVPPVVFTLEGLVNFDATALLQTWPNQEEVRAVFERAVSDVFTKTDKVLVAYVLLSAATASDSQIKEHAVFLKEFVENVVGTSEDDEQHEKYEDEETASEESLKTNDIVATKEAEGTVGAEELVTESEDEEKEKEVTKKPQCEHVEVDEQEGAIEKCACDEDGRVKESHRENIDAEVVQKSSYEEKELDAPEKGDAQEREDLVQKNGTEDIEKNNSQGHGSRKKERITWLTKKILEASDVDPDLRRLVLALAADSPKYAREMELFRSTVSNVEEARTKAATEQQPAVSKEDAVNPVKKIEEVIPAKKTEEHLLPIKEAPVAPEQKIVLPLVSEAAPMAPIPRLISPSSMFDNNFLGFPRPPPKISPLVWGLDVEGSSCPPHSKRTNETRWILWFYQDVATVCGDFVGYLKSREFMHRIFLPRGVIMSVGGRRPDIMNNRNRPQLPNHELPLHLELATAARQNPGTLLGRVMDTINDALVEYAQRFPDLFRTASLPSPMRTPPGPSFPRQQMKTPPGSPFDWQQMGTPPGPSFHPPNAVRNSPLAQGPSLDSRSYFLAPQAPPLPIRGPLEFRRSRGPSDQFSGVRGRGGPPSVRGGRGDHRQQPPRQQDPPNEEVHQRHAETGRRKTNNDQAMMLVPLKGVTYKDYEEKFGDSAKFYNLKKSLRCRISTLNRKSVSHGDYTEPLTVKIQGDTADLDNAVRHIKNMFGLDG